MWWRDEKRKWQETNGDEEEIWVEVLEQRDGERR